MESKLENAVQLLQSEGFAGAYSFVFMIRWASLAGDKALLQRIGKSLEEMEYPLPMSMRSIMRRPGPLSVNLPRRF